MQAIHGSPVSRLQAAVLWDRYVQSLAQSEMGSLEWDRAQRGRVA
jgi:hypothetical protein